MPATGCSAGLRRRPRCAARRRARRAPAAVDEPRLPDTPAVSDSSASTSSSPKSRGGWLRSARRSALRSCRSDTGSTRPIGPVSSCSGAVAVQPVGHGRQHRQHRPRRRLLGDRHTRRRRDHRYARRGEGAGQRRAALPHRADDHGHLRPRHPVDEVGPAQRVDDQRRLGVRRRGQPHRHRARILARADQFAGRSPAPGNRRATPVTARATAGAQRCDSVSVITGSSSSPAQQGGIGAAVGEHRLVGVTGDDGQLGARRQHPHQAGGLRVEVLGVVDQQQLDPRAFGGEQLGVDGERLQCGADEFGRAQRGHGGLRGGHPDGGPQQHRLLVLLRELARGQPFRTAGQPADALQRNGIHAAFGAAGQQVAQLGGEPDGAQRRPQLAGPGDCGAVAVLEIAREQLADDAVLLGGGDQPRRRIPVALGGEPQHREGVRVHRADERFANDGATTGLQQRRRDRGARLRAEPCRTRQQQNGFRIGAGGDVGGRGLDQRAGLAGARSAQHAHHTANTGFGQRRRAVETRGVRCGHVGMTPRGSDKSCSSAAA